MIDQWPQRHRAQTFQPVFRVISPSVRAGPTTSKRQPELTRIVFVTFAHKALGKLQRSLFAKAFIRCSQSYPRPSGR